METDQLVTVSIMALTVVAAVLLCYHILIVWPLQQSNRAKDDEIESLRNQVVTRGDISRIESEMQRLQGLEGRFNEAVKSRVDDSVYNQLIAKVMPYHINDERVQDKLLLLLSRSDVALTNAVSTQISDMVLNDFNALPAEIRAQLAEKVTARFADEFDSYLEEVDFSQYDEEISNAISNQLQGILEEELAKPDSEYRKALITATFNHIVSTIEPEY